MDSKAKEKSKKFSDRMYWESYKEWHSPPSQTLSIEYREELKHLCEHQDNIFSTDPHSLIQSLKAYVEFIQELLFEPLFSPLHAELQFIMYLSLEAIEDSSRLTTLTEAVKPFDKKIRKVLEKELF